MALFFYIFFRMRCNKKGFTIVQVVVLWTVLTIVLSIIWNITLASIRKERESFYLSRAGDLARSWLEQVKAYVDTVQNKDRVSWWDNKIAPLSWTYRIYTEWDYNIISVSDEKIKTEHPYMVYYRTIKINSKDWDNNKKEVVVTIRYNKKEEKTLSWIISKNIIWD